MISFQANYIKPTIIKQLNNKKKYEPINASIVELMPNSEADLMVLNKLNIDWNSCDTLVHSITYDFNGHYYNFKPKKNERFFALTTQEEKFETLDKSKILGLIQTIQEKKDILEIENFQVKPDTIYGTKNRKYKNIGTALLDFIKNIYEKTPIHLSSKKDAVNFYKANGFICTNPKAREMILFR